MSRFKAPMYVQKLEVGATHEPPHLVGADVRKPALSLSKELTLSQPVLREKDQSLVTSAPTLDWVGSWPQCACRSRSKLLMRRSVLLACQVLLYASFIALPASRVLSAETPIGALRGEALKELLKPIPV